MMAASLTVASCFAADDTGDPNGAPKDKTEKSPKQLVSSSVKASETPIPRIWIGLTGSYTPLGLVQGNSTGNITNANGDVFTSSPANGKVGGGAQINARFYKNFWLCVGAIYRFTGYDAQDEVNDVNGTTNIERARVRLIDFPVLIRYNGRKWNPSKHTFYEAGAALREGIGLKVSTNSIDQVNGELGPGPNTGTTYNHAVKGVVAGGGLIAKDDFGIIVSPEVRYTRWFGDTFSSPVTNSQRNQLEITVSFGF